jgi:polyisoprenoid-binding protein YceI
MKKKYFILLFLTGLVLTSFAQADKYFTRDGIIKFTSDAPAEKIQSSNKEVNIIIAPATSAIAIKVVMKSFSFEKQGMKDHFNRDYLETDSYPNATFEGSITNIKNWSVNGTYDVVAEGTLTIHGVSKLVKQSGKIIIEDGKITVSSDFNILLTDYNIKVPNNFIARINNTVNLQINGTLIPYQR